MYRGGGGLDYFKCCKCSFKNVSALFCVELETWMTHLYGEVGFILDMALQCCSKPHTLYKHETERLIMTVLLKSTVCTFTRQMQSIAICADTKIMLTSVTKETT